jgi:hypothetical protein
MKGEEIKNRKPNRPLKKPFGALGFIPEEAVPQVPGRD